MNQAWEHAVSEALAVDDEPTLRRLYAEAVTLVGPTEASIAWLSLSSAVDASAQTG
jgi:hypothetical protein